MSRRLTNFSFVKIDTNTIWSLISSFSFVMFSFRVSQWRWNSKNYITIWIFLRGQEFLNKCWFLFDKFLLFLGHKLFEKYKTTYISQLVSGFSFHLFLVYWRLMKNNVLLILTKVNKCRDRLFILNVPPPILHYYSKINQDCSE